MQKNWNEMTETERIAEAIAQLDEAKKSGIRDSYTTTEFVYTLYNNFVSLINRNGRLTVTIEWFGRIIPVEVC